MSELFLRMMAHQDVEHAKWQRTLTLVNAWVEEEVTLNDLYELRGRTNAQDIDRLRSLIDIAQNRRN